MLLPTVTACSTALQVNHLDREMAVPEGSFVYALPKTVLRINGTLTLNSCGASHVDGEYEPVLDISQTLSVTPIYVGDPDAQYTIPYDQLRSWSKEINVTVATNANKTLSGLNGAINDQAGPVLLAGTLAAVKIAGGLGVQSVPTAGAEKLSGLAMKHPQKGQPIYCTAAVQAALAQIDSDTKQNWVDAKSDADKKTSIANPDIAKRQAEIASLQAQNHLSIQYSFDWSPGAQDQSLGGSETTVYTQKLEIYDAFIKSWLSDDGVEWLDNSNNSSRTKTVAIKAPIIAQLNVQSWTMQQTKDSSQSEPKLSSAGLVLRDPALATLRICRGECRVQGMPLDTSADLSAPVTLALGQLGRTYVLPLHNGLFENSSLAVALSLDGSISSQGNHATPTLASSMGALQSIGDALGSATSARNSSIAAKTAAETTSASFPDTINKALADCLAQQVAIIKLGGKPIGSCQ